MSRFLTCALAAVLVAPSIHAQEAAGDSAPPVIAALSLGLGVGPRDFGGHAGLGVSHRSGDYILRVATSSDLEFSGDSERVSDVGLLYGRRSRGSSVWIRAAAGPSWVQGHEQVTVGCGDVGGCTFDTITTTSAGMAAQVDLVWGPAPGFGLGIALLANVNRVESFGIATLNLFLGRNR